MLKITVNYYTISNFLAGAEGSTQSDDDDANSSVNEALTNVNQADGDSSISNDESAELPSPSKKRRK